MALVSIDIAAMESLVSDMTSAKSNLPSSVATIRGKLDHVLLSTSSVDEVGFGKPVWTWMDDRIRDLNRRLTLARLIAGSTPGMPGVGVVEIDEELISDLSDAEIKALVDELAGKMDVGDSEYSKDVDPRVLEILAEHAHDPYFAKALAEKVSPEQLDRYLMAINAHRHPVNFSDESGVQDFDTRYNTLLNGLGLAFGLASQGTGDLEVPGMAEKWADHIELAAEFPNGGVQRLTLVMSRGSFSTEMLLGVHEKLKAHEGDKGAGAWGVGFGLFVHDPDPSKSPESNLVEDPMGALFQAMGANPEAMRQVFATGETVTVETDANGQVEVNAYLWHVLRHRGADEYSIGQLAIGLQSAMGTPPVEGQPAFQVQLSADVNASIGAIEREVRIAEENEPPWYSKLGHFILDVVGFIPGIGEIADLGNAAWYTAEGNTVDAALSASGAIPIFGWFAVGGKWVRRALSADELVALGKAIDGGADIGRITPGGTVLTKADLTDAAKFTPENFLTPGEMKRFEGRPWLQNITAGNKFDEFMAPNYKHNEIYVEFAGNKSGKARLDSYVPGEEIISRKFTQLGDVELSTAKGYLDELALKYPVGAKIPDTTANRAHGLAGQTLNGDLVLQVPPQKGGVIPQELIEYAELKGIRIVDINGFEYTP